MNPWMNYFGNVKGHYLKKAMFDVLKDRYPVNEEIIDRLSVQLMTENDMNRFVKLVGDLYEMGYIKAVQDHREQLQKAGLVANIVRPQN